jgi:hypothetical protein
MEKWLHVAPASCGTCPTCIGVGITGIALDLVASKTPEQGKLGNGSGSGGPAQDHDEP